MKIMAMDKKKTELDPKENRIKLCLVEEQEILLEAYQLALSSESTIELTGISGDSSPQVIMALLSSLQPDVVLLGTKILRADIIAKLVIIREDFPDINIILLSTLCDIHGIRELRKFTRKKSGGCAFLLKHSIDRMKQLTQIVHAVVEGQVILDPVVMEGLIGAGEVETTFLKELTKREMEVLSFMAKGHRNATIAEFLYVDTKTVERHINSIYSKLNGDADSMHPRVHAIMLYLKATAQLDNYDSFDVQADRSSRRCFV